MGQLVPLLAGERIRVHKQPRRYRDGCWLGAEAWRARVVYSDEDIFVVNKPSALPTQSHGGGCTS
jgi:23S rRNA-/tRNA-specific pseudouridylate synthase